ncbi:lipopolysaccharide core biosynthesis protein rfaS [Halpernia sp. GG3]
MAKKILFIAPDYYGFNEVVFEGLKSYSGAEVVQIISNENYNYKNINERIQNFFSKIFLKRNIKKAKASLEILNKIQKVKDVDLVIINRPDLLSEKQLDSLFQNAKESKALLWDSLEKIPMDESILQRFDFILSFDERDCEKYNFIKITNFYFQDKIASEINYDVAFLGTFDDRVPTLLKIVDYFNENNYLNKAMIYSFHQKNLDRTYAKSIEIINKIIPFSSSFNFYADSFAILDLEQPNQEGLSFRPFEAIGLEKKIITTNKNIKNYDFYDSQNVFIIDNINDINLPESFLKTPYKKLTAEIKEKYFIKNWIQNMIKS